MKSLVPRTTNGGPIKKLTSLWFQQDGAPAHSTEKTTCTTFFEVDGLAVSPDIHGPQGKI